MARMASSGSVLPKKTCTQRTRFAIRARMIWVETCGAGCPS
jgi:hypothetical protein